MLQKTWTSLLLLVLCCCSAPGYSAAVAEKVFADYADALLQIKVLEHASGAKSAIGSGFLLAEPNLVVTNYHVVSEAVLFPQKYQLEFLAQNQQKGKLEIVAVDVVNDLALLKTAIRQPRVFSCNSRHQCKGPQCIRWEILMI